MIWSKNSQRKRQENFGGSRIRILLAVIFLFAAGIVLKLFNLQVLNHDLYTAKASRQHGVAKELVPERGRIFVRTSEEKSGLYPLAANKEFALVYAVPSEILNPEQAVELLAPIFYPMLFAEPDIEEMMIKIESGLRKEMAAQNPPLPGEEVQINKDELLVALEKERLLLAEKLAEEKEEKIKIYQEELLKKLSKKNDPYEPLVKKVDPKPSGDEEKSKLDEIMELEIKGINYDLSDYRYYPEGHISSHILGYVVNNPDDLITRGSYGIEGYFNDELAGIMGAFAAERDAVGELIIVADRKISPAVNGDDIILTIDKTIQNIACRKLNEHALRHGADLGSAIVMEPKSGAIIAMCAYPDFDPNEYGEIKNLEYFNNINIFNAYEPGSVFKVITIAAGLDLEIIEPETVFHDAGFYEVATEVIKNADEKVYGDVTMTEVLEESINTGVMHVAREAGINNFIKYVEGFGFGEKTGIELLTEAPGNISSLYDKMHGDNLNLNVASFGQSITTTPLQLLSAYAAVANNGIIVRPYIVDEIVAPDGRRSITQPQELRRIISPRAAMLLGGMLVNVVDGGHAKRAAVSGYYVAGKTGTAQIASQSARGYSQKTNHTFVGFAPVEDPRFVMITYLKDPKDVKYAASSAAPLFGEIAEFILNYYQIEKER